MMSSLLMFQIYISWQYQKGNKYLFEEAIYQRYSPQSIFEVIPDSTSQKLIPDKHVFVKDLSSLVMT